MTQSVNIFKEDKRLLIEVLNPSKETMQTVDKLFNKAVIDLSNIFVESDVDAQALSEKEDADKKISMAKEATLAPKVDEPKNAAPEAKNEDVKAKPQMRDVSKMNINEAKEWLTSFLQAFDKKPSLEYNAYRILVAYSILRNRLDLIDSLEGKSEKELHDLINNKKIISSIAQKVGYTFINEDSEWV